MNFDTDDNIVEGKTTMDKVAYMFNEINNNDKDILAQLAVLTEVVGHLDNDVKNLKKTVAEHHDQLLLLNKSIEWSLRYGGKLIGAIIFLTLVYEGIKRFIPHF